MKKALLFYFVFISINQTLFAQTSKRNIEIFKVTSSPKIDGKLDEKVWENAFTFSDFKQYSPFNGEAPKQKTELKVLYDDKGIYFGAIMYDKNADSISRTLSQRDIGLNDNADYIAITLGPFNDGINMNMFVVSAAGVQSDIKSSSSGDDMSWNAIWKSEVKHNDSGWIAEVMIPFSELRFSKAEEQTWAFNLYRKINRYKEWSSLSYVDNKIDGHSNQAGELSGLKNLKPSLRLSFTPYMSVLAEYDSDSKNWTRGIRGGLDLRYGITESFTLDMMLIPDFSQIQTDDKILNLSPFEVYYQDNRAFFNEGIELFSKGRLYYSKRIGGMPRSYWDVEENLLDNETIVENPLETQIINASKITGRTKGGLGIGVFNAMTSKTFAHIVDTLSGAEREFVSQPFTNYNMFVFDQSLKNNSHFSVVNANVTIPDEKYSSNVSAVDFKFRNKSQTYQVRGVAGLSQVYKSDAENEYGFSYDIDIEKTAGIFQFGISQEITNETYNPNDMGFLSFNNFVRNRVFFRHKILKPYGKFVDYNTFFSATLQNRFKPSDFMYLSISLETFLTFQNYWSFGYFVGGNPVESNDFYEPRLENRVFVKPTNYYAGIYFGSDNRKKFYFSTVLRHWASISEYNQDLKRIEFNPTLRIGDKFKVGINSDIERANNSIGYVSDNETDIYFGKRIRKTISNAINTEHSFNDKMRITLRIRHYLSSVEYDQFYSLNQDGTLSQYDDYKENKDISFNTFNMDMVFNWRFAPGSDIILVWKDAIYSEYEEIKPKYIDNVNTTFSSPIFNHFSLKVLYYLDYNYLKRKNS
jgi:hypothetical protein